MELYSTIQNEITSFSRKWVKLKTIMLSEMSQPQKSKYLIFFHMHNLDLNINMAIHIYDMNIRKTMKGKKRPKGGQREQDKVLPNEGGREK